MIALINKIIKFSNVDGPGNRMAIFFQGCNMNCKYCHNPETINICNNCGICVKKCPVGALKFEENKVLWNEKLCIDCDNCIKICPNFSSPKTKEYTVEDIIFQIEKVKNFISGITFSGGECSINHIFITEVFKEIKNKFPHLTCFVDTNGYLDFSLKEYRDFVEFTDGFMLDVKAFDVIEHMSLTDKSNEIILKNLEFLKNKNKLYEVRTVIVPYVLNNKKTVEEVSKIVKGTNIRYKLIKFRNIGVVDKEYKNFSTPNNETFEELKELAKKIGVNEVIVI